MRLARHGARVLVLEARSRLGGRATAFNDRETGELVDNGQHVLLGCYRDTLAFLERHRRARATCRFQPQLGVTMVDRAGRAVAARSARAAAAAASVAGVFDWDALDLEDRLSVLRMRTPLRLARRALEPGATRDRRVARRDRRELADSQRPDRAAARDALGSAGAGRAQSAAVAGGGAGVRAGARARCSGPTRRRRRSALPTRPLDVMYAEPARAFIEERGGVGAGPERPRDDRALGDGRLRVSQRRGARSRRRSSVSRRALVCARRGCSTGDTAIRSGTRSSQRARR